MELFTPDFGLVFWMFVSLLVLLVALRLWAWPALMKGIDTRADLIDKGVLYAQNAKEQLENAQKQADEIIAEARSRQADILRDADKMKTQIVEDARVAAAAEAKKEMDAAKTAIDQAAKEAQRSLRQQVGAIALDIASKVVRNQLADPKASAALVDNLIESIDNSKN